MDMKEELMEFYKQAVEGNYPDRVKFIDFMESTYPELKQQRLTEKAQMYLRCLNKALHLVNPKMDVNESWVFFKEDGRQIPMQEVYAFFENVCKGVIEDSQRMVNKSEYKK